MSGIRSLGVMVLAHLFCAAMAGQVSGAILTMQNTPRSLVLRPLASTTIAVRMTNSAGIAIARAPILFAAPERGSTAAFAGAAPSGTNVLRVATDANGIAAATITTSAASGVFLLEARAEGWGAALTVAVTVTDRVSATPLGGEAARAAVLTALLGGSEGSRRLHGPVLLPAGSRVLPAGGLAAMNPVQAVTAERDSWFFWIDDTPEAPFQHEVRYVLLDAADTGPQPGSRAQVSRHDWWPTIALAGEWRLVDLVPVAADYVTVPESLPRVPSSPGFVPAPKDACAILISGPRRPDAPEAIEKLRSQLLSGDKVAAENIFTNEVTVAGERKHQAATRADLVRLIRQAKERGCKKVWFLFLTHGFARDYLGGGVSVGTRGEGDPALVPYADLVEILKELGNAELCLIIDACASGQAASWIQGHGFTGEIVTGSDPERYGYYESLVPALTDALSNRSNDANRDGTVSFQEAVDSLNRTRTDAYWNWSRPPAARISPSGTRQMHVPSVQILEAGKSTQVAVARPRSVPIQNQYRVTLRVADPTLATLSRTEIIFGPNSVFELVTVTGLREGESELQGTGVDSGGGGTYIGFGYLRVGAFRVQPKPLVLVAGTSGAVLVTRHGLDVNPRGLADDTSSTLSVQSQVPQIAAPAVGATPVANRQAQVAIPIRGNAPGEVVFRIEDQRSKSFQYFKVIVLPTAVRLPGSSLCPQQATGAIRGQTSFNPGEHPITPPSGNCEFRRTGALFALNCATSPAISLSGSIDLNSCRFEGRGRVRVLQYDALAEVIGGEFLAETGSLAPETAPRATFNAMRFTYRIGGDGALPGGLPISFLAAGPVSSPCAYSLSPAGQTHSAAAQAFGFQVITEPGCNWSATAGAAWVSVTSGSGTGPGMVSYSLEENSGAASRGTTITAGGQIFSVLQNATPANQPRIHNVVHGASFESAAAGATWITVLGTNLATSTRAWSAGDFTGNNLPTQLDGVSVSVGGRPAYPYYVSPTQLNVLFPDGTPVEPTAVRVMTPAGTSSEFSLVPQKVAPSLFWFESVPRIYAAAVHGDGTYVGRPGLVPGASFRPARVGDEVQLFGTGFGVTEPAAASAQLVARPLPLASVPIVLIGGKLAPVRFAGLVGSGLYQFNIQIPAVSEGDQPLTVIVDGVASPQGAFLSVSR